MIINKMKMEIRNYNSNVGFNEESGKIEGKAIAFNSDSKDMGFIERIDPAACTREFLDSQDFYLYFNHEPDKVLGRCNRGVGNLNYEIKPDGVYFTCDLLDNSVANDARSYIKGGLMEGCSFGFVVDPDKEEWVRDSDGIVRRTIRGFRRIAEFSVVYTPAYAETSCTCRSYDKFLEEEEKRNAEYQEFIDKINKL